MTYTQTLAEKMLPQDHLRMISRYERIIAKVQAGELKTALTVETMLHKLEWHVAQYTIKTGHLPA